MIIDLGDVTDTPYEAPKPPVRVRRDIRHGISAVALLILVLGLLAAGTRPVDPLPLVASFPGGYNVQVLLTGSRAVIASDDTRGITALASYALSDGHRDWRMELPDFEPDTYVVVGTSLLMEGSQTVIGGQRRVEALDLATGAVRWSRAGDENVAIPAGLLIYAPTPGSIPGAPGSPTDISLVDPDTGHVRWTTTVPGSCTTSISNDFSQIMQRGLVELCPDTGQVSVTDLRTGKIVAQRHIDLHDTDAVLPPDQRPDRLLYVGAGVLVMTGDDPNAVVTALRASDLEPLWSGLPYPPDSYLYPCGPDICEDQAMNTVSLAADPRTGIEVPLPPGHTVDTPPIPDQFAAAHGTNEMVTIPYGQVPPSDLPPGIGFFQMVGPDASLLMPGTPGDGSSGTWILAETAFRGGLVIRPLALLHGVGDSCQPIDGYVACITTNSRIALWRLPPWSVS